MRLALGIDPEKLLSQPSDRLVRDAPTRINDTEAPSFPVRLDPDRDVDVRVRIAQSVFDQVAQATLQAHGIGLDLAWGVGRFLQFEEGLFLGMKGSDLIVNAVAALAEHPLPLIIIDMGTATTISVVDDKKNYIGGMILPGIRVSLDSLVNRTSQLQRISLEAPKRLIGKNTGECMKSGVIHGNAACIDGMIDRIEKELKKKATVVATGGLAGTIIPHCTHKIILDDALLLKGLLQIYQKNLQA